ncbi:hypothetical protein M5Y61_01725 [Neisseria meningitidis]|nr:hypothetical protein [Neisseria meningitidis]MCL4997883.1 hypothetical protein [Neisseria meningitidis]MCL5915692.1 hypothetical protein [Neisseria meningitidis]
MQRGPHPVECGRFPLANAAHRAALDVSETQGAAVCRVGAVCRQIVAAAGADAV